MIEACRATRPMIGLLAIPICFAFILLSNVGVHAAVPDWPDKTYRYVVVEQELRELLREFGQNVGLPVRISETVSGEVNGRLPELPPEQFLDRVAERYGLVWYYDGFVLHISAAEESSGTMLPLGRVTPQRVQRELASLGIRDERFPMRFSDEANVLFTVGPPRYVDLVQQMINALNQSEPQSVNVYRGFDRQTTQQELAEE